MYGHFRGSNHAINSISWRCSTYSSKMNGEVDESESPQRTKHTRKNMKTLLKMHEPRCVILRTLLFCWDPISLNMFSTSDSKMQGKMPSNQRD